MDLHRMSAHPPEIAAEPVAPMRRSRPAAGIARSFLVGIAGFFTLGGCGSGGGPLDPPEVESGGASRVATVTLQDDRSVFTVLGSTVRLSLHARDGTGTTVCATWSTGCSSWLLSAPFQWEVDAPDVVSLQEHGTTLYPNGSAFLTALAEGRVEVSASVAGVADTVVVDVVERARVDWSLPTMSRSEGIAIGEDGTTYVSAVDGLQALGPQGDLRWTLRARAGYTPAIGEDGTLYLGSRDGLMAIDGEGDVLWDTPLEGSIQSPTAIGPDGTIYAVTGDGTLYSVDPTGHVEWTFEAPGPLARNRSAPAIDLDGTIYFGSEDRHLYAVTPDGSERWRFRTGGSARSASIGVDGTIYFGNDRIVQTGNVIADSKIFALDPDGAERWNVVLEGDVGAAPAIGFDGTLYMATDDWIYAIDPGGAVLWQSPVGSVHTPIVAADGSVYVNDGDVFGLEADGTPKWEYGSKNTSPGPAAIGLDGTIHAGTFDGTLYEIHGFSELAGSNGGYDAAPWPQERGDRANSGRGRAASGPGGG